MYKRYSYDPYLLLPRAGESDLHHHGHNNKEEVRLD